MNEYEVDDPPKPSRVFHQLGVLVLDGSGSMSELTADKITKADAVNGAVRELLGTLKNSRSSNNFSIAVVTFDTKADIHTPATAVEDIDDYGDFNPLLDHGGGTNIGEGLKCAQGIAQAFLSQASEESVPRSAVIVLMSDGEATHGDAVAVADEIKAIPMSTLCTTLFSAVGENVSSDKDLLQRIATSPMHYRTTYRSDDLRKFFIASVSSGKDVKLV